MQAVKQTLISTPEILSARESVSYYAAVVQEDKGAQDPSFSLDVTLDRDDEPLTEYYQSVYEKKAEDTTTLTTTLTLEKKLENGITLESYLELEKTADDLTSYPAYTYGTVVFEITLPVLQLFHSGFEAKEKASQMELRAAVRDLASTVADSVETTTVAYWDALAQKKILELYGTLETEAEQFLDEMTMLAEKQEYPFANLELLKADVAAKTIQRIAQEQTLYAAKQTLALAMGEPLVHLDRPYSIAGAFPEPLDSAVGIEELLLLARQKRDDLAAEKLREKYYQKLVDDAEEDALPDLDLSLQAGYKGLDEHSNELGYLRAIGENPQGPSYQIGLSYTQSLGNNVGEGALNQAKINLKKEHITISRLEREVASGVLTAFKEFRSSVRVLEKQKEAVGKYKSALDKEILKFTYQMGDLSDRLSAAENYADSLVALIDKQKAYAVALVQLRQACGALVVQADEKFYVTEADLVSPIIASRQN